MKNHSFGSHLLYFQKKKNYKENMNYGHHPPTCRGPGISPWHHQPIIARLKQGLASHTPSQPGPLVGASAQCPEFLPCPHLPSWWDKVCSRGRKGDTNTTGLQGEPNPRATRTSDSVFAFKCIFFKRF